MYNLNLFRIFLQFPSSDKEWLDIANQFESKWQFPHSLGSVDGKHVQIIPPAESGSYYYNYKGSHSIVLMAIVNANLEFIMVDVGTNGRVSDGGIICNTTFYKRLLSNSLNIPLPREDGNSKNCLNYVLIGDEAFTLRPDFLKLFCQKELTPSTRIYNYRLSRARRVVENAFGILAARFRIFRRPINLQLKNIDIVVLACCALHNLLRKLNPNDYTPADSLDNEDINRNVFIPGHRTDISNLIDLRNANPRNHSRSAKKVRNDFKNYFCNEGAVFWQYEMVNVTGKLWSQMILSFGVQCDSKLFIFQRRQYVKRMIILMNGWMKKRKMT